MVEWRNRSRHFKLSTELRTGKHDIGLEFLKTANRRNELNCKNITVGRKYNGELSLLCSRYRGKAAEA
jgi:hypothetical protein